MADLPQINNVQPRKRTVHNIVCAYCSSNIVLISTKGKQYDGRHSAQQSHYFCWSTKWYKDGLAVLIAARNFAERARGFEAISSLVGLVAFTK